MRTRNFKKLGMHRVECNKYRATVVVKMGGYAGKEQIIATAELDVSATAYMIHDLRSQLHAIRKHVDEQIQYAEASL